jgi:hypothetical protein
MVQVILWISLYGVGHIMDITVRCRLFGSIAVQCKQYCGSCCKV